MKKILLISFILLTINSCSGGKVLDIKSPCVSTEDGPCGPRKPINDWWLKDKNLQS